MPNDSRSEVIESLQDILVARATGSSPSDTDFKLLRNRVLDDPELRGFAPVFLRTSRDLDQFWAYIQKQSERYAGRREIIWQAFAPLWERVEAQGEQGPSPASRADAATTVDKAALISPVRAFVSYSTIDRHVGAAVKTAFEECGVECFLAHDDLVVSEMWRDRILEELLRCDLFVPLLSAAFKASDWASQEVGVIAGRKDVPMVPLSIDGTLPFGFMTHIQGRRIPTEGPTAVVAETVLKRYPRLIVPRMIARVRAAGGFRSAEAAMRPLVPAFESLSKHELDDLVDASIVNGQVWSASACRSEYLPQLIRVNASRINPTQLKALQYQIDHDKPYLHGL